ncbi:hypothetical protein PPERSA_01257 [Pseudocohnilembus persalinus]|uniref:Uncharacterized protein n=1 Tax=Pseudocohnilembus persalinus TaxID=266149 RepID=A0A0V0QGV1_PSEPJ|nr:hypothetical protein PPERSA_01257 [Pseudocohnilembus persalinus]|eukprot:KRX01354.1 hypothetical protein PPERSA_01257 [Pseudocohnilembus persalinus]
MSTFEFKELLQNFLGEPGQNLLQLTQMLENSDILKTLEKNPEFGLSLGQFQIPKHEIFGKEKLIKEKREDQINKIKEKKIESQSNKLNVFDFQAVAENQQFLYLQNIQEQVLLQQDQDDIYLHQQKEFNRNSGSFGVNYVNQIQNIIGKNPEQENSAFIKNLQNNVIQDTIETSKTYNKQQMENKQEFFYRQSQMYNKILNKSSQSTFSFQSQFNQKDFQIMIDMSKKINDFGQIKGNNPSLWPENIQEFTENIEKRPISDFFYEQQDFFQEFYSKLDFFEQILKIEDKLQQESQYQIASQLKEIFEKFWCDKLQNEVINNQEIFNFFDKTKQIGNFKIISNDLINSTSQLFTKSSITSDGTYLYLYVGAMNGNAYKIGTGFNGTLPGHLYFTRALNRAEDASWVYLKGKLYLKTSTSIENKVIYIVDPEIIEMCGKVQLDQCKDLFEKPELFHLNKNFQLLNDENENLYFIGKEIKEIKKELTEEQQKEKIKQIETLFQQNYIEFYQNFCVCNKGHKLQYELKEELEKLSKDTRCTQCQLIFNQSNNGGFLCKECKFVRCKSCFSHESQQFVQKIVNQLQNNKNKSQFTNLCPSGHQLKHLEPEVLNKLYNITCDNCQAKLKNTFIGTNRCEMCDYDLCDKCNEKEIGYGNAYTGQYGGKQFSYTYSQPQNNYGYGAYNNKQFGKGGFQGNTGNNLQVNYLSEAYSQFGPDKCKNNHELTFLSNQDIQNRGIQCDGCRNKLRGTQLGSYRCQKCDFDRCEKCYNIQKYLKEKKEGQQKIKKGEKNEESKNSEENQLDICENQLEKEQRDLMDKKEMEMKKNIIEQVLEEENIIKLMEFYLYKFNVDQLELIEMNDENNNNEEIFDKKIRQFFDIYQQKLKESEIPGAEESINQYWNYEQYQKYINFYRKKSQNLQLQQGQTLKTMEKLEKKRRQQNTQKEENENIEKKNKNQNQNQNKKQKLPEIQHYTIKPFEKVLLCQSEVVRNQQNEKRGEFQVLPNSFLNPANIGQNQWSVGNGIIACYGDKGVMLFSTDKKKERVIFDFEKEKEKEKKKMEEGNNEEGKKEENKDKKNQSGNLVDLIMKNQEYPQNIKIEKIKEIYVYLQELGGVENFKKQMNQKIKFGSEKEMQIKDVILNNEIMYQKLLKHCDKIFNQRSFFKLVEIFKQLKVIKYVLDNPYLLESINKMDVNTDFDQQKLDQSQKKGQIANLNISGTYIKTESAIKYQQNPQDILCYDFKNQLYFQLHWSHNGSSFVMESNINVYFQQMNQSENFKLTGELNENSNLKDLFLYCCQNLRNLHFYRNYLPYKFNLYDIVYGQGIHKLKQQIINLQKQVDKKQGNESELKEQIQKHSNLKNKLIQKMNRYLQKEKLLMSEQNQQQIQANNQFNNNLINQNKNKQIQNQKLEIKQKEIILRELKKQFTYISEGSQQNFKSLNQILNLFLIEKGDFNLLIIQEILEQLVLVCWNQEQLLAYPKINEKTKNEKQNQNLSQNILHEVENSLLKILENEDFLRNEKILNLVLSLVFEHGNKIFLRKKCQQVFWLKYLAEINQKLNLKEKNQNAFRYYNKFLQIYVQNKISFQFRFQESFIISQFPVQKITNQTNLQEILLSKVLHQTNKKQKISQNSQFEPIGQLFLDQDLVGKIYSEIYEYIQKKNNHIQQQSQSQQNENIVIGIQKFEFKSNFRNFVYPYSEYLTLQEQNYQNESQNQQQRQNINQILDEQTIKNLLKISLEQPCIFIELLKIINLIFSQSWLEISTLIEDYQKYLIYKNLREMHKKYAQKKQEREKNQENKEEEKNKVKNQKSLEDYDLSYEELFDYKKQMTHQEKMDKNQFQDFKSLSNLKLQDKENIKKMDFELKKRLVLKVVQEIIGPILEILMKNLEKLQIQQKKEQDLEKQKQFILQIDIISESIDQANKALNQIGLLSLNSVLSKVNDLDILSAFNKSMSQICKITVDLQQLEQKIENENEDIKQKKSKSSYINGVEAQAMQVFETQHPYEKKQQVTQEFIQFPGAICLKIEFDLKSATESSQDFLMISGGYKNKQGQTQNPYQAMPGVSSKEGYGNYFRLSGNQFSTKNRQLILIGNFAYIEFQATSKNAVIQKKPVVPGGGAAVSQNEGINPNSWGIKASIYPVYIPEIKQNFLYQFSMQSLINFQENKQIEKFIDKSNLDIFNWNLLMKGLVINENQEKKQNQEDQKQLDSKLVLDNHEQDIYGQINKFKQNLFVKQNEYNQFYFKNYQHSIQRNQSLQQLQKQFKDSQNQKIDKKEEKQQKYQSQQFQQQQLKEQNEKDETHLEIEKEKKNNQNLVVLEYDQKQREKLEENILPINWEIYENFQFSGCQQQELLKIYIQEIKKQEGNFVNLLNKIKQQIPELTRYRQEKMRKTFAKIYQNQWEQLQNLIILVILYHNDLLYSPKELENQAKEDLPKFLEIEEIVRTKNKIIVNALQQEVQWEREKQFIIVGMLECLVKQIKQNQEKQIAEQQESKQQQNTVKAEQQNQEKEKNAQKRKGSLIIQHNKGKKQIKVQRQVSLNLKNQNQIENNEKNKQKQEEQKVLDTPFISSYNLIQESDKYKQQMKDDYLQRYQGAQDETLKHMCTILFY